MWRFSWTLTLNNVQLIEMEICTFFENSSVRNEPFLFVFCVHHTWVAPVQLGVELPVTRYTTVTNYIFPGLFLQLLHLSSPSSSLRRRLNLILVAIPDIRSGPLWINLVINGAKTDPYRVGVFPLFWLYRARGWHDRRTFAPPGINRSSGDF